MSMEPESGIRQEHDHASEPVASMRLRGERPRVTRLSCAFQTIVITVSRAS